MPLTPGRSLAVALAVLAAFALATAVRLRPPSPRGGDAPADAFSAERAFEIVRELGGDGAPRPAGSAANRRTVERLVAAFRELGFETDVQETFACGPFDTCAHVRNVLARVGPPGRKAVVLAAHHDSVPAGPGAADDLSGVSVVLEVARALRHGPALPRPFIALVTDGEEVGLLGAAAFAAHPWAREAGAVVNLEARGTSGPSLMFETSGAPAWIGRALRRLPHPVATSLAPAVYELLPNDTDLTVFAQQGLPGVNLAFAHGVLRYHTPEDDLAHLDRGSLQHQGDNALALVSAIAAEDLEHPRSGRVLFIDVLGLGVLSWRGALGPALAAAAGVALALVLLAVRRRARARAVAWGLGAALAAPLLGAGATALAWLALRHGALPTPFVATPAPFVAAAWAAGVGGALLAVAAVAPRAGAGGLLAGGAVLWAALSVALAVRLPGASIVGIVPALASGGVAVAWALSPLQGAVRPLLASVASGAGASLGLLPVALLLPELLGVPSAIAVAALVALVAFTAAPAAAGTAGAARWAPPGAAFVAAAVLAGVQAFLPPATPAGPARLTLAHYEDAGRALWVADWRAGELPAPLREAAAFARPKVRPYPKSTVEPSFVAPAEPLGLPAPRAEILATDPDAAGRRVRLRLSSPRGAPRVALLLPPEARLLSAVMNGVPIPAPRRKWTDLTHGVRPIGCATTPPGGVEVELLLAGKDPIDAVVMDLSYGLPPSGEPLARARPPGAIPSQDGDVTLAASRVGL